MRESRPPVISLVILLALFFGGGFVGERLAITLTPSSGLARLLGFLALPASLIVGFFFWAGAAGFTLVVRFLRAGAGAVRRPGEIPPGARGFLGSSVLTCLIVGAVSGLLSQGRGFFSVCGVWVATGLVYGVLCWRLAQSGWVQFPRE